MPRIKGETQDVEDDTNDTGQGSGLLHVNDHVRPDTIKKVWDQMYESGSSDDLLVFGSSNTKVDLSHLHPNQAQIFRLWQIYLENVDPLLKVTHTPTLQPLIINAASNVADISPTMEAVMLSIYCVAILSLKEDKCQILFGSAREDLLTCYQSGCRQALQNCRVLRTGDRDCLTALYLYLISVRPDTDPRALSSTLGLAIRIAHRMGIHNESTNGKCNALEAEMRRRLWWSLVVFDNRISEMFDYKTSTLAPTWDCRTPSNVNDFEIRPEMKDPPAAHEKPTEAIFSVVRSTLGGIVRHSAFHRVLTNQTLNTVAKDTRHGFALESSGFVVLEKAMEEKHLAFCNPENPLHFMTIWTTRGYLSKMKLLELYAKRTSSSAPLTDKQHSAAVSYALSMLNCDTKLMSSPLTQGYHWLQHFHFPFPAYITVLQELTKRPTADFAENAWEVIGENYAARLANSRMDLKPIFIVFSWIVLKAWEACEAFSEQEKPLTLPRVVVDVRNKLMELRSDFAQSGDVEQQPDSAVDINVEDLPLPIPMDFGNQGLWFGAGGQHLMGSGLFGYPDIPGQTSFDVDMNQVDWTTMDWSSMQAPCW
ncbi:uncharacterized protein K452DRAFT_165518 [Aplosporella prunicola CBS 121167]|uniref:Xylanolytic transcriptional activator regulatory domain-containing protein n=1 Tax=Aplosporella prunicola CBS 121167 TaxID=1176127 RepID=A0A6A6AUU5_9PEZI|nr:uncharacterized protein K452DRAFT_165518 [Aplosporella prunicola CBS 121167]KAF2135709.1 hypothetical protein K452DRAFT_165518 [Aplosporella prunicola CBS 121167]